MRLFKTIVVLLFLACQVSCFQPDNKQSTRDAGYSHLKIAIDSNANFYIDSFRLSSDFKNGNYRQYDSTLNSLVYVFDSVSNGYLTLTMVSFLDRTFEKKINLQSDTIIYVNKTELNNFNDVTARALPPLDLSEGDSVIIGLSSIGCFHFLKENIIISKGRGIYTVGFNTTRGESYGYDPMNIKKEFDSTFVTQLNNFRKDCEKLLHRKTMCISTTSAFIYIRIGNSVYRLPDIGCGDWDGYNNLIKAIDPPWPKEKNAS